MNVIIIDTCVFISEKDYFFNNPKLKFVSGLDSNTIMIPSIIFEEIYTNIKKKFLSINSKITENNNKLKVLSISERYINFDEEKCNKILNEVKKSLEYSYRKNNVVIEHYPQELKLEDVIKRALNYKKPFKSDGGDAGLKDYIIWQTILQFAQKHRDKNIIFITNNKSDFLEGKNIHKDLQDDFIEQKLDGKNFQVVTLDEYIKSIADFEIKDIDKIINDLIEGKILISNDNKNIDLNTYLDFNLLDIADIGTLQSDFFGYEIELNYINYIELEEGSIVCRAIDDNELYIEFELMGEFNASIGDCSIKPIKLILDLSITYDKKNRTSSSISIDMVTCLSDLNSNDIYEAECCYHARFM